MKYPRVDFAYACADSQSVKKTSIEPEASTEIVLYHGPDGFVMTAFDVDENSVRTYYMDRLHRWGGWDEIRERALFEAMCYSHYLSQRESRLLRNVPSLFDPGIAPYTREELFERRASGDYVAVAYQQAWGGWKLARGA